MNIYKYFFVCLQFLHSVIDEVCGRSTLHYRDYADLWDLEQWWEVIDGVKTCSAEAVRKGLSKEEVIDYLQVDLALVFQ